jgi:hypothetical protein
MGIEGKVDVTGGQTVPDSKEPRSLAASETGIRTGADFAHLMSSLMSDIISGRVTPAVGNATCNAGGKLLKVVEMQYKFGTPTGTQGNRMLILSPDTADK